MSEEKGNLKGLAISFILISLIMGAGVGIVYFVLFSEISTAKE